MNDRWHLAVADLELDDVRSVLRAFGEPALIYSDLPYNKGAAALYRRWAGDPRAVNLEALFQQAWHAATATSGPVLLEVGRPAVQLLIEAAGVMGIPDPCVTYETTYGHGKGKAAVVAVRWTGPDLTGIDSWELPGAAILAATQQGDVVADFCVGLGLTAREAIRLGRRFVGSDLNPARLARTRAALERMT